MRNSGSTLRLITPGPLSHPDLPDLGLRLTDVVCVAAANRDDMLIYVSMAAFGCCFAFLIFEAYDTCDLAIGDIDQRS